MAYTSTASTAINDTTWTSLGVGPTKVSNALNRPNHFYVNISAAPPAADAPYELVNQDTTQPYTWEGDAGASNVYVKAQAGTGTWNVTVEK